MEARHQPKTTGPGATTRALIPLIADPDAPRDKHLGRRAAERQGQSRVLRALLAQDDPTPALTRIVETVERLLDAKAGLCLPDRGDGESGGPVCVTAAGADACTAEVGCPLEDGGHPVTIPLRHFGRSEGFLWLLTPDQRELSDNDQQTLATFAELANFAMDQALAIRGERHEALLSERDRIAREMHDSLAQVLGVTHLRLSALSARADLQNHGEVRHEILELAGLCRDAYADVREAILGLRESTRPGRSFLRKLEHYTELFSRRSNVNSVLVNTLENEPELSPQSEAQAFRIVQEALNNVRKHAQATTALLRLSETVQHLVITVEDDGQGFDATAVQRDDVTFGLRAMAERADLMGGEVRVESRPGRGTTVTITVPKASTVRPDERDEAVGS